MYFTTSCRGPLTVYFQLHLCICDRIKEGGLFGSDIYVKIHTYAIRSVTFFLRVSYLLSRKNEETGAVAVDGRRLASPKLAWARCRCRRSYYRTDLPVMCCMHICTRTIVYDESCIMYVCVCHVCMYVWTRYVCMMCVLCPRV